MNWNAWLPLLVLASSLLPGLIIFGLAEHRVSLRTGLNLVGALVNLTLVGWMLRGGTTGIIMQRGWNCCRIWGWC